VVQPSWRSMPVPKNHEALMRCSNDACKHHCRFFIPCCRLHAATLPRRGCDQELTECHSPPIRGGRLPPMMDALLSGLTCLIAFPLGLICLGANRMFGDVGSMPGARCRKRQEKWYRTLRMPAYTGTCTFGQLDAKCPGCMHRKHTLPLPSGRLLPSMPTNVLPPPPPPLPRAAPAWPRPLLPLRPWAPRLGAVVPAGALLPPRPPPRAAPPAALRPPPPPPPPPPRDDSSTHSKGRQPAACRRSDQQNSAFTQQHVSLPTSPPSPFLAPNTPPTLASPWQPAAHL